MMKKKLLEMAEKNPALYNILMILKYRHDERFMELVRGARQNPNLVVLQENPEKAEQNSVLYRIEIGGENDGFFALVRWTLDALYFCDCFSFLPEIRFSENILYYDSTMPRNLNPYEYYFEQPLAAFQEQCEKAGAVIEYEPRNGLKAESLNDGVSYQISEKYIDAMSRVMRKYLHFNEETKKRIERENQKRTVNETVLGVHIRGTDYKSNYKNHPQYIPPSEYYGYIDEALEKYGFQKVYIATDDEEILQEFLRHYGEERVLYSSDTQRSSGTEGVHTSSGSVREHHKYMLGMDVICDMCALAGCGGLISSLSQVSLVCRIYKKSKNENFRYDKTLSHGVNKTGKTFQVKKEKTRE